MKSLRNRMQEYDKYESYLKDEAWQVLLEDEDGDWSSELREYQAALKETERFYEKCLSELEALYIEVANILNSFCFDPAVKPEFLDLNRELQSLMTVWDTKLSFSKENPHTVFSSAALQAILGEICGVFQEELNKTQAKQCSEDKDLLGDRVLVLAERCSEWPGHHRWYAARQLLHRDSTIGIKLGEAGDFTFTYKFPRAHYEVWRETCRSLSASLEATREIAKHYGAVLSRPHLSRRGILSLTLKLPRALSYSDPVGVSSYEDCRRVYEKRTSKSFKAARAFQMSRIVSGAPAQKDLHAYVAECPSVLLETGRGREQLRDIFVRLDPLVRDIERVGWAKIAEEEAPKGRRLNLLQEQEDMCIALGEASPDQVSDKQNERAPLAFGSTHYRHYIMEYLDQIFSPERAESALAVQVDAYCRLHSNFSVKLDVGDLRRKQVLAPLRAIARRVVPRLCLQSRDVREFAGTDSVPAYKSRLLKSMRDILDALPEECGQCASYCSILPYEEVGIGGMKLFPKQLVARFWNDGGDLIAHGPIGMHTPLFHRVVPVEADAFRITEEALRGSSHVLGLFESLTGKGHVRDTDLQDALDEVGLVLEPQELRVALSMALEGRLFDSRAPGYPCLGTMLDCLFMPYLSISIQDDMLVFERSTDEDRINTRLR